MGSVISFEKSSFRVVSWSSVDLGVTVGTRDRESFIGSTGRTPCLYGKKGCSRSAMR
jgi:hypothetical protein